MNIKLGDQILRDVQIPLLWGSRVVSQDRQGRLSVVDVSEGLKIEIIGDRPVPGVPVAEKGRGFDVLMDDKPLYHYDPNQKILSGIDINLPSCQIGSHFVRVGANTFGSNGVTGSGIGIVVTQAATWIGGAIPQELRALVA